MYVDSDFVLEIADLHESLMNDPKYEDEGDLEKWDPDIGPNKKDDERYLKMHKMLSSLNEEEWLDFLCIYYLGRGSINDVVKDREYVKSLGSHVVEQILGKINLAKYLREADKKL
jgi:hypothetical protein